MVPMLFWLYKKIQGHSKAVFITEMMLWNHQDTGECRRMKGQWGRFVLGEEIDTETEEKPPRAKVCVQQ